MSGTDSPLKRSISLSGVIWFLIAALAVIAIGAAVAAGRYAMAVVGVVFVLAAITLGYRASAARRAAKTDSSPQPPA
jgi:type IV secretory pathway VirB2 component (pilin)